MTAAPLIATDAAPLPEGGEGFWVEGAGGARLRAAIFPAMGTARGSVVLSPGRTEPLDKFFEVIGELQGRGFWVLVHDWRGQGLSHRMLADRLRGHAEGSGAFLEDFRRLLDQTGARLPRPWIGMGNSMGGCLTALAAVQGVGRFDGLFLTAPMLGLKAVKGWSPIAWMIAKAMVALGRGGEYVTTDFDPTFGTFEGNVLTRDPARFARFKRLLETCADLMLGGVTWGWLAFALDARFALARSGAAKAIACPLTIVAAGDERLVLNLPSCRFAERAPQGRYVEIPGALHEVLMETDPVRAVVWSEFDALAALVCGPAQEGQRPLQATPVA